VAATPIERRIRWSGLIIALGLLIQLCTLFWTHPLAFMAFLLIGCPLVALGLLLYLHSLVSHAHAGEVAARPPGA
jgi:hypothetical protein